MFIICPRETTAGGADGAASGFVYDGGIQDSKIEEDIDVARKKLVEHNALVQAVEMGLPRQELMEKFGYRSVGALKVAYYHALAALEKIPVLNNKRAQVRVENIVRINSRGSLVVPKKLVEALGLNPADSFTVEKNGAGLSLTVVKKSPRTILKKKASGNAK